MTARAAHVHRPIPVPLAIRPPRFLDDQIVVIDQGRVAESGTHATLVADNLAA